MVADSARRHVVNIAHRGASGHAPEHTIAAYDLALEMGADFIEQDLHLTSDGVLVAFHDATLQRITGNPDLVRDTTLADIRALDVGRWFNDAHPEHARRSFSGLCVPTMGELFARYGRSTKYYVEVKDPHLHTEVEQEFVDLLKVAGMMDHALEGGIVVQSFDPDSLGRFQTIEPLLLRVRLFALIQDKDIVINEMAETATYARGIGPDKFNVDDDVVSCAHDHGLFVHPFTADTEDEMNALFEAGADGIFTNYPDRLAALTAS